MLEVVGSKGGGGEVKEGMSRFPPVVGDGRLDSSLSSQLLQQRGGRHRNGHGILHLTVDENVGRLLGRRAGIKEDRHAVIVLIVGRGDELVVGKETGRPQRPFLGRPDCMQQGGVAFLRLEKKQRRPSHWRFHVFPFSFPPSLSLSPAVHASICLLAPVDVTLQSVSLEHATTVSFAIK
ncbi:hypothetical protein GOP47_0009021, partial [Adiantum capillus-veneris]